MRQIIAVNAAAVVLTNNTYEMKKGARASGIHKIMKVGG
jgi:hypothetical protein